MTYLALLRGVNLAGRNRLSMADLRALLLELGAQDVATYLQSGNAVFRSPVESDELTRAIEERITRDLGLEVTVLLRTHAQLAAVLAGNPLLRERDTSKLHVTFLAEPPDRARVRGLEATPAGADELRVAGREVYLYCPNGYGRTKLGNAFIERRLAVAATTRKWKTVTNLAELAGA